VRKRRSIVTGFTAIICATDICRSLDSSLCVDHLWQSVVGNSTYSSRRREPHPYAALDKDSAEYQRAIQAILFRNTDSSHRTLFITRKNVISHRIKLCCFDKGCMIVFAFKRVKKLTSHYLSGLPFAYAQTKVNPTHRRNAHLRLQVVDGMRDNWLSCCNSCL
jgi:hypothetical protein